MVQAFAPALQGCSAATLSPQAFDPVSGADGIFVLPHVDRQPAMLLEFRVLPAVALTVPSELDSPPLRVVPGYGAVCRAAVPEAAVNEDGDARTSEGEVGSPGESPERHAVAETTAMELVAQSELRSGIPSRHPRHLRSDVVRQRLGAPSHRNGFWSSSHAGS